MTPGHASDATGAFVDPLATVPADAPPDLSFLEPPVEAGELGRLGQYRVLRVLGAGGMGVVLAAEDTHLRRPVALKVMRKELVASPVSRGRFLQEARAAAGLTSDHIITVYQVGLAGDVPFLALQFLHGESLQDRLVRTGPLPPAEALVVARQAAAGLADAHAAGVVHRDIKPANLWLETEGPGGPFKRVKILDFGLARWDTADARLTASGLFVGTPHFMAPEQAAGEPVDGRADLFSLGCVLYTMLTGDLPFSGSTVMMVLMALANTRPPRLADRVPGVPAALSDLVERLLAKDPADRPARAADVAAALDAVLAGVPLPALPTAARPPAPAAVETLQQTVATPAAGTPSPSRTMPSTVEATITPFRPPAARPWLGGAIVGAGVVAIGLAVAAFLARQNAGPPYGGDATVAGAAGEAIKVGVLHSQTGTMALSESPVVDATLLAIDELNAAGGVLGRHVKAVVADGASDPATFARLAERLLADDEAAALFGCWTSASRKAVKPVVERLNGLLFYPVQYEGLEQSPHIVYFGAAPNQQILPAIDYLTGPLGKKRLFLVGSDYVFPRAAHAIVRDALKDRPGVAVVGEAFIPLGGRDVAAAVAAIRAANPDAIVNTINGSTNVFFFRELRAAGVTAAAVPTLSVSVAENELTGLDVTAMAGDYLAATYFQSVDTPEGRAFVAKVRDRYGAERVASDAMAAAYGAVNAWAASAAEAGTPDPTAVRTHVRGRSYRGPRGALKVDADNQHVWQPFRVGRVRPDGQVEVVAGGGESLRPDPFPPTRPRAAWERFLNDLYVGWDGHWQAPAHPSTAAGG